MPVAVFAREHSWVLTLALSGVLKGGLGAI